MLELKKILTRRSAMEMKFKWKKKKNFALQQKLFGKAYMNTTKSIWNRLNVAIRK